MYSKTKLRKFLDACKRIYDEALKRQTEFDQKRQKHDGCAAGHSECVFVSALRMC